MLGLLRVQADAIAAGPLQALVGLVGMSGSAGLPPLPLTELATLGAPALATWFESVVSLPSSRLEWLGCLANLVNGTVAGDEVTFGVGAATVVLGIGVIAGVDGHSRVTPTLSVVVDAGTSLRARASRPICCNSIWGPSPRSRCRGSTRSSTSAAGRMAARRC